MSVEDCDVGRYETPDRTGPTGPDVGVVALRTHVRTRARVPWHVRVRSETTYMADVIVIDSPSEELEDSDCGIAKLENVKVVSVFDRRYTDCMIL